MGLGDIAPGLIVRHTNRRLGKLDPYEACERLISGRISFSEFVDQGHERVLFPAVYQQGLAGSSQGRREVPEQGSSCEPGPEDDHARTAPDAHATSHP